MDNQKNSMTFSRHSEIKKWMLSSQSSCCKPGNVWPPRVSPLGISLKVRINDIPRKWEPTLYIITFIKEVNKRRKEAGWLSSTNFILLFFPIYLFLKIMRFNSLTNAMDWNKALSRGHEFQPQHHNIIIIRQRTIQNMLSKKCSRSTEAWSELLNNLL